MALPSYTFPLLIFCCSILGMLLFAVLKPVINIKIKRVSFGLETFFIFPLLGAIVILAAGFLEIIEAGKSLWSFAGLNPVGILILFFSMVYISKFLDTTGFFEFVAVYSLSKSGGSSVKLFIIIYAVVSILTVFTSNDVVILTFTPFIHYFAKTAGISPTPFLFAEFFAANTWSMIFIISNPTNVVLGTAFQQSFGDFAKVMTPASVVGGVTNCVMLYLIFRENIKEDFSLKEDLGDPWVRVRSKVDMSVSLAFTIVCIILLAVSSAPNFGVEMWMIAGGMAVCLFIYNCVVDIIHRKSQEKSKLRIIFSSMPYPIIPFLLSLFILVNSLQTSGFFNLVGDWMGGFTEGSGPASVAVFGLFSTVAANVLNNIPMSVAFAPVIKATGTTVNKGAVYASVIGANLGANLTPLGALAGLMWLKILKERDIEVGFIEFLKVGLIVTPLCLAFTMAAVMGMTFVV